MNIRSTSQYFANQRVIWVKKTIRFIASLWCTTLWSGLVLLMYILTVNSAVAGAPLRDWDIKDSIELTYFVGDHATPDVWPTRERTNFVVPSPDRLSFFYVTQKGRISSDSVIYELVVFSVRSIQKTIGARTNATERRVRPLAVVQRETFSPTRPGISNPMWQADSRAVLFKGLQSDGAMHLFRLDLGSGHATRISDGQHSVSAYSYRDGGLIYSVSESAAVNQSDWYPMAEVGRTNDGFARNSARSTTSTRTLYVGYRGGEIHRVNGEFGLEWWIAPGGRLAVGQQRFEHSTAFVLVDLVAGRVQPMLNVGIGRWPTSEGTRTALPSALWSADGTYVVLVNTQIPHVDYETELPDPDGFIVDFDVERKGWSILEPLVVRQKGAVQHYVSSVRRTSSERQFVVARSAVGKPSIDITYQFRRGGWFENDVPTRRVSKERGNETRDDAALAGGLSIVLRQGINDPPVIVASDGSHEVALTKVDPVLQGVWRAPVEPFHWTERNGDRESGGLLMPRKPRNNENVPVVVQVVQDPLAPLFLPDGPVSSGYAAQAFAARGFVVLQLPALKVRGVNQEGPSFVARLNAAIEALDKRALIDRTRIGILGHSRNGFQVLYAITHPGNVEIAAAAAFDSYTGSYAGYLADAAQNPSDVSLVRGLHEGMAGGSFWEKKSQWLEHEVTFNVDKVRTPLLYASYGSPPTEDPYSSEIIGSFRLNKKPLEYVWLPGASHWLTKPRQRHAAMEASVDWMMFWLMGVSPANPDRAARWQQLREQQRAVLAGTASAGGLQPAE